jgi:hypothetical protein
MGWSTASASEAERRGPAFSRYTGSLTMLAKAWRKPVLAALVLIQLN